jgi:hypothetical protein
MSGEFVIWDLTQGEADAIMNIFKGSFLGHDTFHKKGEPLDGKNINNGVFLGWNPTTRKVYENGKKWLGYPSKRDLVPPHKYIQIQLNKVDPIYGYSAQNLRNNLSSKRGDYWNWVTKLAIVPISGQMTTISNNNLNYSSAKLNSSALLNVKSNLLDPNVSSKQKYSEVTDAFFTQLELGNSITLEIYHIDGQEIN